MSFKGFLVYYHLNAFFIIQYLLQILLLYLKLQRTCFVILHISDYFLKVLEVKLLSL